MTDQKPKIGRPKKTNTMSPAERKTRERARLSALAEYGNPHEWDTRVCILILNSTKFSEERRRSAWIQLGKINNWVGTL